MKMISKVLATTAAAVLAIAPAAAQANTRAGDSGKVYSAAASQPGQGKDAKGENLVAPGILIAVLAAAAAAGIIIVVDDDDDDEDDQSPGT